MAKSKKQSYEAAMKELEQLKQQVESDDIGIDELSSLVKRSVELIASCKSQLKGIEKDIDNSLDKLED